MLKPTWQTDDGRVQLYLGDNLKVAPHLTGINCVVADPPYGCGKAEWDEGHFPVRWYRECLHHGPIYIITGGAALKESVRLAGDDFVDVIAARNMNSRTRSNVGFSNWLATVVANGKPSRGIPNAFDFCIRGTMPDHPSPKPIEFMEKLVGYVSQDGDSVLDPFMGSGTTGIACIRLGRKFIGIEIEPKYFEIAKKRIQNELAQGDFFREI